MLCLLLLIAWTTTGMTLLSSTAQTQNGQPIVSETDFSPKTTAGADIRKESESRMLGWSSFAQGAYLHQFKTYNSGGGSFNVYRFFVQAGVSYAPDSLRRISLGFGYGLDAFGFDGNFGLPSLRPWKTVHTFRISLPLQWGFNNSWKLFVIPTFRTPLENGAKVKDALQGGGFVGVSWRISDRLTIGPGVGVISEIEDSPTVFPVLLIDWEITERLVLATGSGVGATLGPGLILRYLATDKWSFYLGGRYEKLRFRLNGEGPSPNGVGEDKSFPLYLGVTYKFYPMGMISLGGGVELGEEQRLEDPNGNLLVKQYYDPAAFLSLSFRARF